jgi:multidrug efflux pump subunit AcrB
VLNKGKEKISSFQILVIFVVITFLGGFIIPKLSVKLNPSESLPTISVSYSWTNASPYTIEKKVTSILEGGFNLIKGVSNINSKSSKGTGYITLEFDKYTNIDIARFEIATVIRQLFSKLPDRVSYPQISVNKPNDDTERAFLSYSIHAKQKPFEIQKTVKNVIEPQIGAIDGIDKSTVFGAQPKEYVIRYKNSLIKQLNIDKQLIIEAIKQYYSNATLGEVSYNSQFITLAISNTQELGWHIPIKKFEGRILYVDDITEINEVEQEAQNYFRVNGKNAIMLSIYGSKNANTIILAKQVKQRLNEIHFQLPEGYEITETYNSTEYLQKELNKIYKRTIYTIIILLLFILIASRSFQYLFVVICSLSANLGVAFLLYFALGIEIQLYSLAGITISLGLIIDNGIVMIDHIKKQHNKNVFIPILASTLTTSGALSIIYFLDDRYKVNLIDFAWVIIINLTVSLFIALFLIPALLEKVKIETKKPKKWSLKLQNKFYQIYYKLSKTLIHYKKLAIIVVIFVFGIPVFLLPQKIITKEETLFSKLYNTTLGNEWYRENIRPHLDSYLGGSFRLFNNYVFEKAYYGKNEETKLYIRTSMEKGATVHQMNEAIIEIENYLEQFGGIKQYVSNVYSGDYAQVEITFKEQFEDSSFPYILKSRLTEKAINLEGMNWTISGVGEWLSTGGGTNEPINFTVKAKGYNYEILNKWADTLKVSLEKHPRIQKVFVKENNYWSRKPAPEYRFELDKEKLALLNSSPSKVFNELKTLTLSKHSDISLNIKGQYIPIRMESENSTKYDIWKIKNIQIDNLNKPLNLKEIATITEGRESENIFKENQEYIRLVQFQYTGSAKFGGEYLNDQLEVLKKKLPLGYQFERNNNRWFLNDDKNNNYTFLLVLVLSIIYFICAMLFESFKQPFIILSIVPISFIGVFLTFYLFDFNFDQGGLASFILLSGITVNSSIYIINSFNKLLKSNPDEEKLNLYLEAFKQKIFPIILTIFSTILGFIPFVMEGQNEVFWFAMGVGIIGGLLFSLLGILIYLPIFTLKRVN